MEYAFVAKQSTAYVPLIEGVTGIRSKRRNPKEKAMYDNAFNRNIDTMPDFLAYEGRARSERAKAMRALFSRLFRSAPAKVNAFNY